MTAANDRRRFTTSGLAGFAKGWFERGRLTFTSGANAGRAAEVRTHRKEGGQAVIELWQPMHHDIAAGVAFIVTAGCDKRFSTLPAEFANGVNFRGFPHMPGNDFALTYARRGDDNDGGPVMDIDRARRSSAEAVSLGRDAVPAPGVAEGRRLRLPRPGAGRMAGGVRRRAGRGAGLYPDWAEARGRETLAEAAARHMLAVRPDEAEAGDVLLFRWRENLPAKHAGILVEAGRFVHAHQGAAVAFAALTPWWRRRVAYAFRFQGVV